MTTLSDVGYVTPQQPLKRLFPSYYEELEVRPTTFFLMLSPLVETRIDHLTLSRGQKLSDILEQTRTPHMLVFEDAPES